MELDCLSISIIVVIVLLPVIGLIATAIRTAKTAEKISRHEDEEN